MDSLDAFSSQEHRDNPQETSITPLAREEVTLEVNNKTLTGAQLESPEVALADALAVSDEMTHKPMLLNGIGETFLLRFLESSDLRDIDNSVVACEAALKLLPATDDRFGEYLQDYGICVLERHKLTESSADINEAISSLQRAVQLCPKNHPNLPDRLNDLGISFHRRFERGSPDDLSDIGQAISCLRRSVQLTPAGHAKLAPRLDNLGLLLLIDFEHTGSLIHLSEAIITLKKAVQIIPDEYIRLPVLLYNLGYALETRFEHTKSLADISEAISNQQRLVHLTPQGDADLPDYLGNLGRLHHTLFGLTRNSIDISEAILTHKRLVQITPEDHGDLPTRLDYLGIFLQAQFEFTGDLTNISEAISMHQRAVSLTPEGHEDLPIWLNNLGNAFSMRFESTGALDDMSHSLLSHKKSLELTLDGDEFLPSRLNNLGVSLQSRFARAGDLADISEAISFHEQAVQLCPEGDAQLPLFLDNLGNAFSIRFEHTGDLSDISNAISFQQKAVQLTPEGLADLPRHLNNLGISLQTRFERMGNLGDISEAILSQQKAVQLTSEGLAKLPVWLNNLGNSLRARYGRTRDPTDICEAISALQRSVHLTSEGHAGLPARLNNLGTALRRRFEELGDLADISEAISAQQRAVQLTPGGHTDLPVWLNNLGVTFQARFVRTRCLSDIFEAISSLENSIHLTPEGHADLCGFFSSLGKSFSVLFEITRNVEDVQKAILHYRRAARSASGPPSIRLSAAMDWASWAQRMDKSQLLEAYQTAIPLISQVAGLEKTIHNRYTSLVDISDITTSAAAAAFEFNRHGLALEWLEQGRCLVWSQLNDLRTPIDDLRNDYPDLADVVMRVSKALENSGSRAEPPAFTEETDMVTKMSLQDEAHTHIKLAQEWDHLLVQIRAIPQFEDFLRPASCSTLCKSIPDTGHVVVVNIHQDRSDALILTSGADQPLHIALQDFSYETAVGLRQDLKALLFESRIRMRSSEHDEIRGSRRYKRGGADILRQLWTFVVKPILGRLGCSDAPASKIPRIWWCTTGPLAFLPIHAAGIYHSPAESTLGVHTTLSDFAISSYIPTVRLLVEKKKNRRKIKQEKTGLLMISQPDTPKLTPIPGTSVEVEAIQCLLANHKVQHQCMKSGEATISRVKTNMDVYSCIHFACHAAQDTTRPLKSGFFLYDGKLELSSIIKEDLKGADLAFLSACQTSTGDEKLSEEAVHLAGGMLAAGYRGVVATMWSIKDNYGPKLAEEFYRNLLALEDDDSETGSKRLSSDRAAYALHHATRQARKTLDDSESALLTWTPFVHFGF